MEEIFARSTFLIYFRLNFLYTFVPNWILKKNSSKFILGLSSLYLDGTEPWISFLGFFLFVSKYQ